MDREMYKKFVAAVKEQLKSFVEYKIGLTKTRTEYKYSSRGTVPEAERLSTLSRLDGKRSDTKDNIRHLHLAYGYIRGQHYKKIEAHSRKPIGTQGICYWLDKACDDIGLGSDAEWLLKIEERTIKAWINGEPSPFSRPRPAQIETTGVAA